MYPKNSASPAPIQAKVVNASTGAPITADVVAFHIQGVTRGAVGGTAAAHIANGLWTYTPTQAETNYDQFTIEFYHADAVADGPIVEVKTGPAHDGTSITAVTNLTNAPTNGDLTATMKTSVTTAATAATPTVASVTGDVGGKVLGGGASAFTGFGVSAVVAAMADDTIGALSITTGAVTKIQAGLSTYAGTDTAGTTTLLSRVVGTIAAGTHNAQSGDAYAYLGTNLGLLGANATEAGGTGDQLTALAPASTALSSVVWTGTKAGYIDAAISGRQATISGIDTAVATIAKLDTTVVLDGAVYDFTAAALASAPSGTGGDATEAKQDAIIALIGTPSDTDVSTDIANVQTAVDALDTGSGTGSNTIQFKITNADATLLENATVTLRLNDILKATGSTDATGRLSGTGLAVAATGTYELSVTCDGYNGHTADLVVTAGVNTMVEVELASLSFPDSTEPDSVTVRWKVKLGIGRTTAGAGDATVYAKIKSGPGDAGYAWGNRQDSDATDASGYVYFANVPIGCTLSARLGASGSDKDIVIPTDATTPYDAGELVGDA